MVKCSLIPAANIHCLLWPEAALGAMGTTSKNIACAVKEFIIQWEKTRRQTMWEGALIRVNTDSCACTSAAWESQASVFS